MSNTDPRFIVITKGALGKVDDFLEDYKYPVFVTDAFLLSEYKTAVEDLMGAEQTWLLVSEYESGEVSKMTGKDIILGFGGGRSLDTAKLLARSTELDWIAVPTAASHDGIASNVASVCHNGYRYSERCKSPVGIIADLSIIEKAPPKLKLAGLGDIVCKASSLEEWELAHNEHGEPFDRSVYSLVRSALESVLKDQSLQTLIRALIDAGRAMSIFGSSRPCSGTEHAISHAMDRNSNELHGLQVAFATPLCLHFLERARYAEYDAQMMYQFLVDRQMPHTLKEMKMSQNQFIQHIHHGLDIMKSRNRYSVLEHLEIEDAELSEALHRFGY
ncbi:MAG: iron-containing alcohol dehydrogenase [Candidatus Thorarchaeota archaeon]|nr:iron-containing alcohol dehydrogenase [Candidatus Thorarchaeota archaeon]